MPAVVAERVPAERLSFSIRPSPLGSENIARRGRGWTFIDMALPAGRHAGRSLADAQRRPPQRCLSRPAPLRNTHRQPWLSPAPEQPTDHAAYYANRTATAVMVNTMAQGRIIVFGLVGIVRIRS
jgi:hypothetical protein